MAASLAAALAAYPHGGDGKSPPASGVETPGGFDVALERAESEPRDAGDGLPSAGWNEPALSPLQAVAAVISAASMTQERGGVSHGATEPAADLHEGRFTLSPIDAGYTKEIDLLPYGDDAPAPLHALANQGQEFAAAPMAIHVDALATHLPALVVRNLSEPWVGANRVAATDTVQLRLRDAAPLKVVELRLEPASLGAITVRMKLLQSRIEIEIDADAPSTLVLLHDAKEALASALDGAGLTLDALDLKMGLRPPSEMRRDEGGSSSQPQSPDAEERNSQHEERPGHRKERDAHGRPQESEARDPRSPRAGVFV